ncbi:MAG TPA: cytochrome c-type biogenesis CcmF C-terminal domain-containing protein, partial [Caulobacteraceae bacterium]|nr:cytochrome c-type biogenesis CcmF C-terminal domain-containing protein [Caulobacteraceae bacterium]
WLVMEPKKALASLGVALGAWLIAGALVEVAERVRAFRAPWGEVRRRLVGLPRGAWGMTLAHIGLGVFALGAAVETSWRVEAAQALSIGQRLRLGEFELRLDDVRGVDGPNYVAERGLISITRDGEVVCVATPERRAYHAGGQTTSEVHICPRGLDQLYVVLGERREGPRWLVRGYMNPWVQLIFIGPFLMAFGGVISLSDRRLRLGVGARR